MAGLVVDWDGLLYYDSKIKTFIKNNLIDCLKIGGSVTFEELPPPSLLTLNYLFKIENNFISNEYFEVPQRNYPAGTIVQVSNINNSEQYLYTIFDSSQSFTDIGSRLETITLVVNSLAADVAQLQTTIDSVDNKIDSIEQQFLTYDERLKTVEQDISITVKMDTLANYYTKEEVRTQIDDKITDLAEGSIDLSGYVTEEELAATRSELLDNVQNVSSINYGSF